MRQWCNHIWMQWEWIRLDGKNDLVEKINSTKYWNVSYWNVGGLSLDDFGTWVPAICLGCSWYKGWFRQSGQLCPDPLNYICWPPPAVSISISYFAHQSLLLTFPGLWDGPSVTLLFFLQSTERLLGLQPALRASVKLLRASYPQPASAVNSGGISVLWTTAKKENVPPELGNKVWQISRICLFVIIFCLFLHLSLTLKKSCPITFRKQFSLKGVSL